MRPKILIERGRLVVTSGKDMILGGETSKSHPGRIDVHMGNGLIGHMTYAQALAEFKKEGVGVEAFEQAFSKLKKNRTSRKISPNVTRKELEKWKPKAVGAIAIDEYLSVRHGSGLDSARRSRQHAAQSWKWSLIKLMEELNLEELEETPGFWDHLTFQYWLPDQTPKRKPSRYYKKGTIYLARGKPVAFRKGSNLSIFSRKYQ